MTVLGSALLHTRHALVRLVDDLASAGLVWKRGNLVSVRSLSSVFPVMHIVAVECKVNDWRRVLRQAAANTWFASESYILIPSRDDWSSVREEAKRTGVGVLTWDSKRVAKILDARRRRLPSSYGSWIVNEWVVGRS